MPSHLNNFLYNLTLCDSNGTADTLGVTGYHRFYTEDRGWVTASELYLGETVRTAHGDVSVTSLVRDPGVYRVYNMTVEADHDYYVGDLTTLTHNMCAKADKEFFQKEIEEKLAKVARNEAEIARLMESIRAGGSANTIAEKIQALDNLNGELYKIIDQLRKAAGL